MTGPDPERTEFSPCRHPRVLLLYTLLILIGFASPPLRAQRSLPVEVAPGVLKVGVIEHYALIESSGLTESTAHPGVFWSHNDTEAPTFLFALTRTGSHIGAYELQGARVIDLEAIAAGPPGFLYLADTGTNGMVRSHSAIHRVIEPDLEESWGPARVERTWFIRFPGQREDCEGFFVWNDYGYLIGKYPVDGRVPLYRFALADDSESILLEQVSSISVEGNVSDLTISADGARLGLVTSQRIINLFIGGDPASAGPAPRRSSSYDSPFMEGGVFVEDGFMVTSEGIRDILLFTNRFLAGAPIITARVENQTVFEGEAVQFEVVANGFPSPAYQWSFTPAGESDIILLEGQTNAVLTLTNVTLQDAGTYTVTASNLHGVAETAATLTVLSREIDLRITEAMSSEILVDPTNEDWWELTSFDPRTNDLSGWRYNESTGGLFDAFVIPEGISIRPGESIVFVEDMTREEFLAWWGPDNFAPDVQVITFTGLELSLSSDGDSIRLWNDEGELVASATFGLAQTGVSFIQDPLTGRLDVFSQLGVRGAFQAVTGGDIGSPGRVDLPIEESAVSLTAKLVDGVVELQASGDSASGYVLEATSDLESHAWSSEGSFGGTNPTKRAVDLNGQPSVRFYRLRRE